MNESDRILERALSLGDEGRWEEMAAILRDAIEADPEDEYLLCWLGVAERELGNEGAAYEYFLRCIALDPEDPRILAIAGSGLAAFDDPQAETVLRAAALTGPELPETRLQYGSYLAREGHFELALENLRAAIELAPDDPGARAELGAALALKGDHAAAADAMEDALALAPDDSWTRVLLGLVRWELGERVPAAEALVEAATQRPDDAEAQLIAALAAAAQGWDDAAQDALARALQVAEGSDTAMLEQVEDRMDQGPDAAAELLDEDIGPSALHDRLMQPL